MAKIYDKLLEKDKISVQLSRKLFKYAAPIKYYIKELLLHNDSSKNHYGACIVNYSLKKDDDIECLKKDLLHYNFSNSLTYVLCNLTFTLCDNMHKKSINSEVSYNVYDIFVKIGDFNDKNITRNLEPSLSGYSFYAFYPFRIHLFSSIDNYVSFPYLDVNVGKTSLSFIVPSIIDKGINQLRENDKRC